LKDDKIDLASGDYAQLLRAPDLRLVGLTNEWFEINRPFTLDFPETRRACFYYVKQGAAFFRSGSSANQLHYVTQGTAVGVEGHPHQWLDRTHLHHSDVGRVGGGRVSGDGGDASDLPLVLFTSSIDRSAAVLQRLPHGTIIVPAEAQPYADMIRGCVDLIALDKGSSGNDSEVSRRLAEVIMLQLVSFARSRLWHGSHPSEGILHDEFLLRAMAAFFAKPGASWTVEGLAKAAGLSRAAFSARFRKAFEDTPLKTINRLRLQLASDMLRRSSASLTDIAGEIGFGSAPALVRAFSRHFGQTPGQWRTHYRKG